MVKDSILDTVKDSLPLGLEDEDSKVFDNSLILMINTFFNRLYNMGIGPDKFKITDNTTTWNDYFNLLPSSESFECIKTWMILRVGLLISPPESSTLLNISKETISEIEFTMLTQIGGIKYESNIVYVTELQ